MAQTVQSRHRIIRHGEVFTPPQLVNDMLDLVAHECERIDSRFLEPACGDGNFVAEVLRRKLLTVEKTRRRFCRKWERDAFLCVCSGYGIELLFDNVIDCRNRLLTIVDQSHRRLFKKPLSRRAVTAVQYVLSRNIVHADALAMRALNDRPIVFSEWSPVNGTLIKRRDFTYEHLLRTASGAMLPSQRSRHENPELISQIEQALIPPAAPGKFGGNRASPAPAPCPPGGDVERSAHARARSVGVNRR